MTDAESQLRTGELTGRRMAGRQQRAFPCNTPSGPQGGLEIEARRLLMDATPSGVAAELVDAMFEVGVNRLCAKRLMTHLQVSRATLHRISCDATGGSIRRLFDQARLAMVLAALLRNSTSTQRLGMHLGLSGSASLRRVVLRSARMPLATIRRRVHEEGSEFARRVLLSPGTTSM